ncbi:FUSC family protein [Duganella ginsengisoli]|uniref:FUSC family protein n=2 Tax=Pseudoduganella ginsengisoli TaxID=1462440 RepID=A0A6L6Q2L6_9BURK|nr:FUSC family protein [Pseudoduganella ginsengisoli]
MQWMAGLVQHWAASDGARWLFVARTLLAAFGALGLAFHFGLDSPSTAMTTTFILALPSAGMVLEKAYYRLIGTVVGCAAALVLCALFIQQAPLLFAGLSLWLAACTCGAALHRNQQSYSFVLAGYTAAMIAIPALNAPDSAFMLAATRLTEVGVGIVCAGLVHDVLFPRRHQASVLHIAAARHQRFAAFCRDVLSHRLEESTAELAHLRFAADIAALETGRAAASFEAAHTHGHTRRLHAYNSAFMAVLGTSYTLHRLLLRLRAQAGSPLPGLLEPRLAALAAAMARPQWAPPAAPQAATGAEGLAPSAVLLSRAQQIDLETAHELLDRFTHEYSAFAGLHDSLAQPHGPAGNTAAPHSWAYEPATPWPIALASGARAACALLSAGACWYWLAWPYAANALILSCIFCALASSSPRPAAMIRQILSGFLLAWPLSFATEFWLVMQADSFATLVLAAAPVFALGAWLATDPKRAGMGIGVMLFAAQVVAPANQMQYDMGAFLNAALAMIGGVLLSWAVFAVLLPQHTMGRAAYIARALWRETRTACTARTRTARQLHRLRHRFDNRVRDLLNQLAAASGPAPGSEARAVVRQALMLLELGHAAIGLRALAASAQPGDARTALEACVQALAAYCRRPSAATHTAVQQAVLAAGATARTALPGADAARQTRLRAALADLHALHTSLLDQPIEKDINHAP